MDLELIIVMSARDHTMKGQLTGIHYTYDPAIVIVIFAWYWTCLRYRVRDTKVKGP